MCNVGQRILSVASILSVQMSDRAEVSWLVLQPERDVAAQRRLWALLDAVDTTIALVGSIFAS